jgi:hypothetical protein
VGSDSRDDEDSLEDWLERIESKLDEALQGISDMSAATDALTAQVASNTTVVQSALTLINGIAAQITAAGVDPVKLAALTASLKSDDDALAAAVAANTPAAPKV